MYIRARATPTNPNSPQQQEVRAFFGQLAALWVNTLTPAQRAAWDVYALQVWINDSLGESRNIGGLGHYIRSNVPRLQAGMARVDDGPTVFSLPPLEPLGVSAAVVATQLVTLDYETEPGAPEPWLSEDGAGMPVFISRPQNLSINYFKGPYRFAAVHLGDSGVPAVFPASFVAPFPFVLAQRLFVRVELSRADGRLSLPQFLQGDTEA